MNAHRRRVPQEGRAQKGGHLQAPGFREGGNCQIIIYIRMEW